MAERAKEARRILLYEGEIGETEGTVKPSAEFDRWLGRDDVREFCIRAAIIFSNSNNEAFRASCPKH